jgi:hypothetical protein
MGTRHLYWILTGPSFVVWIRFRRPDRIGSKDLIGVDLGICDRNGFRGWIKRNLRPDIAGSGNFIGLDPETTL